MGFRPVAELSTGVDSNTDVSANFKALYDNIVYNKCKEREAHTPSRSFAPSSFRCDRISYFRLRGVEPDANPHIDTSLAFTAQIGEACHRIVQANLKEALEANWISVRDYLEEHPLDIEYVLDESDEFETKIEFFDPPVRFACDGILKIGDEYYLLEIKTSEYSSFKSLREPKAQHVDQVVCYGSLLRLHKALVLYVDRMYGNTKCFELQTTDEQMQETFDRMQRVQQNVKDNIAPPGLASNDYWCSYCKYKNRCKQW